MLSREGGLNELPQFITTLVQLRKLYSVRADPERMSELRLLPSMGDGENADPVRDLEVFEILDLSHAGKRVREAFVASAMYCSATVRKFIPHGFGPLPERPVKITIGPSCDDPAVMDVSAMSL